MTKGKESLESTNGTQDPSSKDWVTWLKDLATIAGSISAAAGIVLGAWTYTTTQWTKNDETQRAQLSTYSTYGQYLKKYQVEIQPALGRLMSNKKRLALDKDMRQRKPKNKYKQDNFCALLIKGSTTGTGFELLNSKNFGDVRLVHNYYESIGYGLAQGQLDFEVIFDLITVPAYWNIQNPFSDWYRSRNEKITEKDISQTYLYPDFSVMLPWRSCIGSNYFGPSQPLSDFSDSVDRLGYNYLFARMKYLYKRSCSNGRAKTATAFIQPDKTKDINQGDLDATCEKLHKRIFQMAASRPETKTWMKLYDSNKNDIDPLILFKSPF